MTGMLVRASVRRGGFELDAALDAAAGETIALLGPNGSGKSTLLAVIAGLLRPRAGTVRVGDRLLTDVDASGPVIHVAPERRGVGLLGQDPLLFPHLDALDNVAFAPRAAGTGRQAARDAARRWLSAVGLAEFATARPLQLSGGQRQRVALARALAAEPDVLLLDEPFAALDVESAAAMRELVREHVSTRRLTTVLVTHDAADAALLAGHVVLLHDGRVEQHGPTAEVLGAPRSAFAAALVGAELLECAVDASGSIVLPGGRTLPPDPALPPHSTVTVGYAPGSIAVSARPVFGDEPTRLEWIGTVASAEPSPGGIRLRLAEFPGIAADVAVTVAARGLGPGAAVRFDASPTSFTVTGTSPGDPRRVRG